MKDIIAQMLTKPLGKNMHQAFIKAVDLKAFDYLQSVNVDSRALDCL